MNEDELRQKLTPAQYHVLREKGTEPAFTGALLDNNQDGMYHCAACGNGLFSSDTKFESGSGWPSFYAVADEGTVNLEDDSSFGMRRTEVKCAVCGSHLGHVFDDGPQPTGQRFCINSLALDFKPERPKNKS